MSPPLVLDMPETTHWRAKRKPKGADPEEGPPENLALPEIGRTLSVHSAKPRHRAFAHYSTSGYSSTSSSPGNIWIRSDRISLYKLGVCFEHLIASQLGLSICAPKALSIFSCLLLLESGFKNVEAIKSTASSKSVLWSSGNPFSSKLDMIAELIIDAYCALILFISLNTTFQKGRTLAKLKRK